MYTYYVYILCIHNMCVCTCVYVLVYISKFAIYRILRYNVVLFLLYLLQMQTSVYRAILVPYYNDTDRQSMFNDNVNLLNASTTANTAFEQYVMLPRAKDREIIGTRRGMRHTTQRESPAARQICRERISRSDSAKIITRRRSDRSDVRSIMCVSVMSVTELRQRSNEIC